MKKLNYKLLSLLLLLTLNFNLIKPAYSQTVLEEIQQTGLLKVGIRSDAIPFGYRDNNQQLRGICLDFVNILNEQLKKTIDRDIILVKIFISSLYNRFEIVEDGIVHLECGPNTIREITDYEVQFSEPFFVTGIKFFAQAQSASRLINSDGSNLTIGLLRYTTTEQFIKEKYPQAKFKLFQGVKGSIRAIQAVQQGRIDAFANDGILLLGESVELNIDSNRDFAIVPPIPLTCERYGLILPKNDPSWRSLVNLTIESAKDTQILKQWLPSRSSTELNINNKACK